MIEFNKISLEIENNIGIMKFNDPEVRNAVSPEMLDGFWDCLNEIEKENSSVKCLLITGEGKGFCAGANLSSGSERSNTGRQDAGHALETKYHPILRRLRNLDIPIVTAVNGAAAGIGMSFALMGDIVLASKSSFFLQAFRRIGLVPDGGSTWLLPRLIGNARAKELSILGERLSAEKAYEWGLINRLTEDSNLMEESLKIGEELANGPMSLRLIWKAFWESSDNTYEEQLNLERELQFQAGNSEDFREGVQAFLDKRDAKFKGK